MRDCTLVFLVKKSGEDISEVCLAMKKRGFGEGRWNGAGGKVDEGESIESAAKREVEEEIGVTLDNLNKSAELSFFFSHKPDWNQKVHVYLSDSWSKEITESEEMKPAWFKVESIPFNDMWPDDIYWLPQVLKGSLIKGSFTFAEGDKIINQKVEEVPTL